MTTNPSIFEKAIGQTEDYDGDILAHVREGWGREEIYTALTVSDVQAGADYLLPVHEESGGEDGYVSLEVNPAIAHDYEATVREAMQLAELVSRKNAMIKIPATPAGVRAIRVCTAQGLSINATLIFSRQQYQDVAEAYIEGLAEPQGKTCRESPRDLAFVSRIARRWTLSFRSGERRNSWGISPWITPVRRTVISRSSSPRGAGRPLRPRGRRYSVRCGQAQGRRTRSTRRRSMWTPS